MGGVCLDRQQIEGTDGPLDRCDSATASCLADQKVKARGRTVSALFLTLAGSGYLVRGTQQRDAAPLPFPNACLY